jgi:hypothetical protein
MHGGLEPGYPGAIGSGRNGYEVYLFETQWESCTPHPAWSVPAQIQHDGPIIELPRVKLFQEYDCIGIIFCAGASHPGRSAGSCRFQSQSKHGFHLAEGATLHKRKTGRVRWILPAAVRPG